MPTVNKKRMSVGGLISMSLGTMLAQASVKDRMARWEQMNKPKAQESNTARPASLKRRASSSEFTGLGHPQSRNDQNVNTANNSPRRSSLSSNNNSIIRSPRAVYSGSISPEPTISPKSVEADAANTYKSSAPADQVSVKAAGNTNLHKITQQEQNARDHAVIHQLHKGAFTRASAHTHLPVTDEEATSRASLLESDSADNDDESAESADDKGKIIDYLSPALRQDLIESMKNTVRYHLPGTMTPTTTDDEDYSSSDDTADNSSSSSMSLLSLTNTSDDVDNSNNNNNNNDADITIDDLLKSLELEASHAARFDNAISTSPILTPAESSSAAVQTDNHQEQQSVDQSVVSQPRTASAEMRHQQAESWYNNDSLWENTTTATNQQQQQHVDTTNEEDRTPKVKRGSIADRIARFGGGVSSSATMQEDRTRRQGTSNSGIQENGDIRASRSEKNMSWDKALEIKEQRPDSVAAASHESVRPRNDQSDDEEKFYISPMRGSDGTMDFDKLRSLSVDHAPVSRSRRVSFITVPEARSKSKSLDEDHKAKKRRASLLQYAGDYTPKDNINTVLKARRHRGSFQRRPSQVNKAEVQSKFDAKSAESQYQLFHKHALDLLSNELFQPYTIMNSMNQITEGELLNAVENEMYLEYDTKYGDMIHHAVHVAWENHQHRNPMRLNVIKTNLDPLSRIARMKMLSPENKITVREQADGQFSFDNFSLGKQSSDFSAVAEKKTLTLSYESITHAFSVVNAQKEYSFDKTTQPNAAKLAADYQKSKSKSFFGGRSQQITPDVKIIEAAVQELTDTQRDTRPSQNKVIKEVFQTVDPRKHVGGYVQFVKGNAKHHFLSNSVQYDGDDDQENDEVRVARKLKDTNYPNGGRIISYDETTQTVTLTALPENFSTDAHGQPRGDTYSSVPIQYLAPWPVFKIKEHEFKAWRQLAAVRVCLDFFEDRPDGNIKFEKIPDYNRLGLLLRVTDPSVSQVSLSKKEVFLKNFMLKSVLGLKPNHYNIVDVGKK